MHFSTLILPFIQVTLIIQRYIIDFFLIVAIISSVCDDLYTGVFQGWDLQKFIV